MGCVSPFPSLHPTPTTPQPLTGQLEHLQATVTRESKVFLSPQLREAGKAVAEHEGTTVILTPTDLLPGNYRRGPVTAVLKNFSH